jgi:curved DNA-binding protein CbpA
VLLFQTYYDLLEVPANAPAELIKDSYEVLADIWHPDRFPTGTKQHQLAGRKLREISAAYEVLANPQRRVEYDRRLFEERRVSGISGRGRLGPPPGQPNLPAMLAYAAGPLGIVFLLMPSCRRDGFVSFSAWQSILFSVTAYLATLVGPWMGCSARSIGYSG